MLFTESQTEALLKLVNDLSSVSEMEIRFGKFQKNKFISGITGQQFYRILNNFGSKPMVTRTLETVYQNGIKKIEDRKTKKIHFQQKQKVENLDITEYNFRIGVSNELVASENDTKDMTSVFMRFKERFSFTNGSFRHDLTKIKQTKIVNNNQQKALEAIFSPDLPISFEYEIEYIGKTEKTALVSETIEKIVKDALQLLQESTEIISASDKEKTIQLYKHLVGTDRWVGNKPVTLTTDNLDKLKTETFYVTPKADGDRVFLLIDNRGICFIIKPDFQITKTGLTCSEPKFFNTVLDGELTKIKGVLTFLGFDILVKGKQDIRNNNAFLLDCRLDWVDEIIGSLLKTGSKGIQAEAKKFEKNQYTGAKEILDEFRGSKRFEIDGLVFTPVNVPYSSGKQTVDTYKWKPEKDITIDFYIVKTGLSRDNNSEVWELYMATTDAGFKRIPADAPKIKAFGDQKVRRFTPKGAGGVFRTFVKRGTKTEEGEEYLDRTVVEFRFDKNRGAIDKRTGKRKGMFVPIRVRWDKTARKQPGNFEKFAFQAWDSIQNPVTEKMITTVPKGYTPISRIDLVARESKRIDRLHDFNAFVLTEFFNTVKLQPKTFDVLDLSIRTGENLETLIKKEPNAIMGVDQNPQFVKEVNDAVARLKTETWIGTAQLDLSKESLFAFLQRNGIDGDFNLAFSSDLDKYFGSKKSLSTYLQNVSENLTNDGLFVGTAFNGPSVFQALANKESISGILDNCKKWEITRKYKQSSFSKLDTFGNEFELYIDDPLLNDTRPSYLVDFDKLADFAKGFGLEVVKMDPKFHQIPLGVYSDIWSKKLPKELYELIDLSVFFYFRKTKVSRYQKIRRTEKSPVSLQAFLDLVQTPPEPVVPKKIVKVIKNKPKPIPKKKTIGKPKPIPKKQTKRTRSVSPPCIDTKTEKSLLVKDLKKQAKEIGVKVSGTKEELCERLSENGADVAVQKKDSKGKAPKKRADSQRKRSPSCSSDKKKDHTIPELKDLIRKYNKSVDKKDKLKLTGNKSELCERLKKVNYI